MRLRWAGHFFEAAHVETEEWRDREGCGALRTSRRAPNAVNTCTTFDGEPSWVSTAISSEGPHSNEEGARGADCNSTFGPAAAAAWVAAGFTGRHWVGSPIAPARRELSRVAHLEASLAAIEGKSTRQLRLNGVVARAIDPRLAGMCPRLQNVGEPRHYQSLARHSTSDRLLRTGRCTVRASCVRAHGGVP